MKRLFDPLPNTANNHNSYITCVFLGFLNFRGTKCLTTLVFWVPESESE